MMEWKDKNGKSWEVRTYGVGDSEPDAIVELAGKVLGPRGDALYRQLERVTAERDRLDALVGKEWQSHTDRIGAARAETAVLEGKLDALQTVIEHYPKERREMLDRLERLFGLVHDLRQDQRVEALAREWAATATRMVETEGRVENLEVALHGE